MREITPSTIKEAYQILTEDGNAIVRAGNTWLPHMDIPSKSTVVDIGRLGLSYIHSTTFTIQIGAATPMSEVEDSDLLNVFNNGILNHALQGYRTRSFREQATVGGELMLKYRYSDLIPALLVTDPMVLFYGYEKEALEDIMQEHLSYIPLEDFLTMEPICDIMTEIVVPKTMNSHFVCRRDPESGQSILNLGIARYGSQLRIAFGARPYVAKMWRGHDKTDPEIIVDSFDFGDDEFLTGGERKKIAAELLAEAYEVIDFR